MTENDSDHLSHTDYSSLTRRGELDTTKVHFEIGWHLTLEMKVNNIAQYIDASAVLNANNRVRDILEPGHDPHSMFKDFTYLEDFKTARFIKVCFVSVCVVKACSNILLLSMRIIVTTIST
ncbi:unnamed protein product [Pieris macdunnoughi]|uniref:Uncharacterized protein n=1 Tax=Pieris macdunnoughi TaxID=345717 RepID=A0A821SQJ6_9NEOP|nr:unnamed protein product [Pieris macdunnoughi]